MSPRLPSRTLFGDRAARLEQLAVANAMGDYLRFVARLAQLQQEALGAGVGDWRLVLRRMLREMSAASPAPEVMARLGQASDDFYETQAEKLRAGIGTGLDLAAAPFVGAALQVQWVGRAIARGPVIPRSGAAAGQCPACGSPPVASIVRIGADSGQRYLHCSLCATEWHMVRIKCAHCETTKGIHYLEIEGGKGGVKAECCDGCGSYLKICYMDKDPLVDPVADDLATTSLDLLLAERGQQGVGVNFMLLHDAEE